MQHFTQTFAFYTMWDGCLFCFNISVVLFAKTDSCVWFQGGMINWNRLFPPLRHRHNANYQDHRPSEQDTPPPTEVSEEQVNIFLFLNGIKEPVRNYPFLSSFGRVS